MNKELLKELKELDKKIEEIGERHYYAVAIKHTAISSYLIKSNKELTDDDISKHADKYWEYYDITHFGDKGKLYDVQEVEADDWIRKEAIEIDYDEIEEESK